MDLRFPRTIIVSLLVAFFVSTVAVVADTSTAQAASPCASQKSGVKEPTWINVKDARTGIVYTRNFKAYVGQVMASGEWPSHSHFTKLVVGAMATKQYAWYYVKNWRGGVSRGKCYHVVNTTADQLWRPGVKPTQKQRDAVNAVWHLRLLKWGKRFFLTGYRTGSVKKCGADSNGWKLYARSAGTCAWKGKSPVQINKLYFTKTAHKCSGQRVVHKGTISRGKKICRAA